HAVEFAWRAGRRTLAWFQTPLAPEEKADGTPVTLADRECERVLRESIRAQYPEDGLIGEEYGEDRSSTERTWILDPIDGTKSFVRGVPLYAVLVAVAIEGVPKVGVIHLPALGETVSARQGGGCYWNGRRSRVSDLEHLDRALVLTSDFPGHEQARTPSRLYAAAGLRRTWGDAYGYAMVATGRAEIMVDPEVAPWDVAAVAPIVEEAGGRFTSLDGDPSVFAGSGLATNGLLHEAALELAQS
ncbi:MAG: inositol monophosphatase family protein, partial [Holophagales bacterium]|nr:inositol monophosphatase family protein [Holophagales bacterium]